MVRQKGVKADAVVRSCDERRHPPLSFLSAA
jgi:hypothetical protein